MANHCPNCPPTPTGQPVRQAGQPDGQAGISTSFWGRMLGKIFPTESGSRLSWLIWAFVVVLAANFVVMTYFTVTVNRSLSEAIELAKPQEGTLTLIMPDDCLQCRDLDSLKKTVKAQNVELLSERDVSAGSSEGAAIIEKFGIQKLPALVFESEKKIKAPVYRALEKNSRMVGKTAIVLEQNLPPYFDLSKQKIMGLVEIMFLTDRSCVGCYDVANVQKPILERFGVRFVSEKSVDIADPAGKELLKKYAITSVPTVILSAEANEYPQLGSLWKQIGTIEEDGMFIFRNLAAMKVRYRDLNTGEIAGGSGS